MEESLKKKEKRGKGKEKQTENNQQIKGSNTLKQLELASQVAQFQTTKCMLIHSLSWKTTSIFSHIIA
jgi:hypothetical protein